MARLRDFNGRFCESEYESAFLAFLSAAGWTYTAGDAIIRGVRDPLIAADFLSFLEGTQGDLLPEEREAIYETVRHAGAETEFAALHRLYRMMTDGVVHTAQDGSARLVPLIDFAAPSRNVFRAVNQFSVEYMDGGTRRTRRPDVLLFVNGLPLCVIELKNPSDANATIYDAWEQIYFRYWRDIPHLLHFCPLACISDGVKTRLGTVRTPYEHFYAWRRVEEGDPISSLPFEETETMVRGVFSPSRFLEVFRDYVYFPDAEYDEREEALVCRYPQFFATRLLKQSIAASLSSGSGKGGTYFGATGCGKTYTMVFWRGSWLCVAGICR